MNEHRESDGTPDIGHRPFGSRKHLRELLAGPGAFIVPGVPDALSARLVERAGFSGCFVTGAGFANAAFGLPDVGLLTMTEVVEHSRRVCDSVSVPVIADADNGYGGALSVTRTVRALEQAGAAGIQLEDQPIPKRCGHFAGKDLVSVEDMVGKILAARAACHDAETVIIARTDAIAVEGFDSAINRARAYRAAGADALFVEAPTSMEQMERIPRELGDVPLVVNIVEGGRTPNLSAVELAGLGYRVVLHANLVLRVMVKAASEALADLMSDGGSSRLAHRMITWAERQELVNLERFDALEERFAAQAQRTLQADAALENS